MNVHLDPHSTGALYADSNEIAARLEQKIEKLGQSLNIKLDDIEKKLEKHVELKLEAYINTIVQLKKRKTSFK